MSNSVNRQSADYARLQARLMMRRYLLICSPQALGTMGEMLVYWKLLEQGQNVRLQRLSGADLRVIDADGAVTHVEVKTAREGKKRHIYQFNLWKKGRTDFRKAEVVVLVAVTRSGRVAMFVIPTADLGDRSSIKISGDPLTYAGKFAKYRVPGHNLKAITIVGSGLKRK